MKNSTENIVGDQPHQNTILCVACMKENNGAATFCRFCNAALSLTDNPDHLQRIAMEGALYAKAVEVKPNIVVLVGVWLLFFPILIVSLPSAISVMLEGEGGTLSFVIFWILIITAIFSGTMLYKVTRNYLIGRKKN
ncbi:MAG: hypothetical protein H0W45_04160 [Acidobacteria bacterium]|nr:hypothetical protein [Acidobacteriota bacterium]